MSFLSILMFMMTFIMYHDWPLPPLFLPPATTNHHSLATTLYPFYPLYHHFNKFKKLQLIFPNSFICDILNFLQVSQYNFMTNLSLNSTCLTSPYLPLSPNYHLHTYNPYLYNFNKIHVLSRILSKYLYPFQSSWWLL